MSARRFSRLQKATALVPLAVLSAAWTANVTDLVPNPVAVAANKTPAPATLPDGSPLPTTALQAPASISAPSDHSEPVGTKDTGDVITAVSATGIPAAALAAYQRATTVINDADKACHLDWPLLAAIGRVESNHGRVGGSRLTTAGIATPAILGPVLTGRHHTSRVVDTDAGRYDGDRKLDRAVGPMQFLPSTWAIVGVDGDGDGQRNPQDINDAALATAVYLCSGSDLSTLAGQRAAVYRYNHSHRYVATVLGVAAAYRAGDYTSVPTDVVPAGDLILPSLPEPIEARPHNPKATRHHSSPHPQPGGSGTAAVPAGQPPATADGKTHHAGTSRHDQTDPIDPAQQQTTNAEPSESTTASPSPSPSSEPSTSASPEPTDTTEPPPSESPTTDPSADPTEPPPSDPPTTESSVPPQPATTEELTDLCTDAITTEWVEDEFVDLVAATDPEDVQTLVANTAAQCAAELDGDSLTHAQARLEDVLAGFHDTFAAALTPDPDTDTAPPAQ